MANTENVDARNTVLWWLGGKENYVHRPRPDLVELLPPGDSVSLTYVELSEILSAVRENSRQR